MARSSFVAWLLVPVVLLLAGAPARAQDPQAVRAWAPLQGADERGLAILDLPSGTEICLAQYSYWVALRRVVGANDYETVYVSPPIDTVLSVNILDLVVADVVGDANPEIVLATSDGHVRFLDPATRVAIGGFMVSSSLNSMRAHDLSGDGKAEILTIVSGALSVRAASGAVLWSYGPGPLNRLEVGQLDNDPALEIVSTNGIVIDSGTHLPQWESTDILGQDIALGDIDADGRQELIVGRNFTTVRAYDVELQTLKWSMPWSTVLAHILVADVQGDARPEILVGGGISGVGGATLRVHDSSSLALLGTLGNNDPNVDVSAVHDLDGDGTREILWSSGYGSGNSRHLNVSRAADLFTEWQSLDVSGPFLGPALADVDGDGRDEIVIASNHGPQNGRILVLEPRSLRVKAVSQTLAEDNEYLVTSGLATQDVDADGRAEILVGTMRNGAALAEIFRFAPAGPFPRLFATSTVSDSAAASSIVVADLEGDGSQEVVVGLTAGGSSFQEPTFRVHDLLTGALEWSGPTPPGPTFPITVPRLFVDDVDGDGGLEIVFFRYGEVVYVVDAVTRAVESSFVGQPTSLDLVHIGTGALARRVLLSGEQNGDVVARWFVASGTASRTIPSVSTAPIVGLDYVDRQTVYLGTDQRVVRCIGLRPVWATARYGEGMGQRVVPLLPDGASFVTCCDYAVLRF